MKETYSIVIYHVDPEYILTYMIPDNYIINNYELKKALTQVNGRYINSCQFDDDNDHDFMIQRLITKYFEGTHSSRLEDQHLVTEDDKKQCKLAYEELKQFIVLDTNHNNEYHGLNLITNIYVTGYMC